MKIEETEDSIRLIPESKWERDKLKTLRERGVDDIRFEDDWKGTGYLRLCFPEHPWDRKG